MNFNINLFLPILFSYSLPKPGTAALEERAVRLRVTCVLQAPSALTKSHADETRRQRGGSNLTHRVTAGTNGGVGGGGGYGENRRERGGHRRRGKE